MFGLCDIPVIAQLTTEDLEDAMREWVFSPEPYGPNSTGNDDETIRPEEWLQTPPEMRPSVALKGCARSMHRACRINAGFEWSRGQAQQHHTERLVQWDQWQSREAVVSHVPPPPGADRGSDMVNLATTIDPTKNREVPMISVDVFNKGIENWRKIVGYGIKDPPAAIRPSMAQYTGFLENLHQSQ